MTYTSTQLQFLECIYWKSCLQTQTSLTDPQNAHWKGSSESCGVIQQRAYHEQVPRSIQFPAPKHQEGSENVLSKQVHLFSFRPLDQLSHGFFLWIKKENSETIFFSSHIWNLRSFGSLSCKRNPSEPLHTLQSNFSAKLFGVFGLVLWQNRGTLGLHPTTELRAQPPLLQCFLIYFLYSTLLSPQTLKWRLWMLQFLPQCLAHRHSKRLADGNILNRRKFLYILKFKRHQFFSWKLITKTISDSQKSGLEKS